MRGLRDLNWLLTHPLGWFVILLALPILVMVGIAYVIIAIVEIATKR